MYLCLHARAYVRKTHHLDVKNVREARSLFFHSTKDILYGVSLFENYAFPFKAMILVGELFGKIWALEKEKLVFYFPHIFTSLTMTGVTCTRAHVHVNNKYLSIYHLHENDFENRCIYKHFFSIVQSTSCL